MPDIASLKLLGLAGIISYATARLAARAGILGYSRLTLVAVPGSGMPQMPKGFYTKPLDAVMLARHVIDVGPEIQRLRFAQGMVCLGAFNRKDELAGVIWIGSGSFEEDAMPIRFHVPRDAAWDAGLWIAPKHRMGRAFAALWAGTAAWLNVNGKRWSISWIADYNLPSLLSHHRMGAVKVGQIMTFRFFHWHYTAEGRPRFVRINGGTRTETSVPHPEFLRA